MKVLEFSAEWCGQCKVLKQKFENFNECEVIQYDVEEVDEGILDKYKIRNLPVTILIDDNDEIVQKWVGLFDMNDLSDKVNELKNG